jgi:hypothetical protein
MGEGCGSTRNFRVENSVCELLDVVYFLFLSNKETKMRIDFAKTL